MTAKTMAEVLAEHSVEGMSGGTHIACRCNRTWVTHSEYRAHLATELSDAGFGLVADARAEALEEAAANIITNDPLDYWNGHLPEGLGFQEAMSRWLKAHAKAKRAAS
jgi:hypothetical protein